MNCKSQFERSWTIRCVVTGTKEISGGPFRFFKRVNQEGGGHANDGDNAMFELLDENKIHTKVSHALRDGAKKKQEKSKQKPLPKLPRKLPDVAWLLRHCCGESSSIQNCVQGGHPSAQLRALYKREAQIKSDMKRMRTNQGNAQRVTTPSIICTKPNTTVPDDTIPDISILDDTIPDIVFSPSHQNPGKIDQSSAFLPNTQNNRISHKLNQLLDEVARIDAEIEAAMQQNVSQC